MVAGQCLHFFPMPEVPACNFPVPCRGSMHLAGAEKRCAERTTTSWSLSDGSIHALLMLLLPSQHWHCCHSSWSLSRLSDLEHIRACLWLWGTWGVLRCVLLPSPPSFPQLQGQALHNSWKRSSFSLQVTQRQENNCNYRQVANILYFKQDSVQVSIRIWTMELFLVPALVVRSASGNTGLPGKKLHLRILLGIRIGLKRNNHHKCLISEIQPILQADFPSTSCAYWADSPQQGGINSVFISKVQLQGSTRDALLAHHGLAKTEEHPWKTCPMENACSYSCSYCSQAQQHQSHAARLCPAWQQFMPWDFQPLWTYCSATGGQGGTLCLTEQLGEMAAKTRAQPNGSLLCNSWQANILRSGKTKLLLSRGNQLLSINVSFCIESCANWNETIPDMLKEKMEALKIIIYLY